MTPARQAHIAKMLEGRKRAWAKWHAARAAEAATALQALDAGVEVREPELAQ